jgi:hypothetical protein
MDTLLHIVMSYQSWTFYLGLISHPPLYIHVRSYLDLYAIIPPLNGRDPVIVVIA